MHVRGSGATKHVDPDVPSGWVSTAHPCGALPRKGRWDICPYVYSYLMSFINNSEP
jgi:hypothetical protein